MKNSFLKFVILCITFSMINACAIIPDKPFSDREIIIIPSSTAVVTTLLDKANEYYLIGQYQQSLQTLERAIRINPTDPVPWYRGAESHFEKMTFDQAIVFAQRSGSLSGAFPSLRRGCWRLIAKSHEALGQFDQAKWATDKAKSI